MIKISEDKIQADSFQWLWNNYPNTRGLYFSIPLGGLRTPREAAKLAATGAVAGTPDTCLAVSSIIQGKRYNALFIEFKAETGKLSDQQIKRKQALESAGNLVLVIRSVEEFKASVINYLRAASNPNIDYLAISKYIK